MHVGKSFPTDIRHSFSWWGPCGSGHAREAGDAVDGTGCAGVRGRARSHRYGAFLQLVGGPVGAGSPAKQATRWMAPAAPVFVGAPAPTGTAQVSESHRGTANSMSYVQFHGKWVRCRFQADAVHAPGAASPEFPSKSMPPLNRLTTEEIDELIS